MLDIQALMMMFPMCSVGEVLYGIGTAWQTFETPPWSSRVGFASLLVNEKVFVFGGENGDRKLNDVWSSSDLKNWTSHPNAAWSPRVDFASVVSLKKGPS